MTDRQTHSSPTAPIAWMSQAYDTKQSTYSMSKQRSSTPSTANPTASIHSTDSYDRPESPTLPPEQDFSSSTDHARHPHDASQSTPTSPTRYHHPHYRSYTDASMPPPPPLPSSGPYYSSMERLRQEPSSLPPPSLPPTPHHSNSSSNTTKQSRYDSLPSRSHSTLSSHSARQYKKPHAQMSDHMASAIELSLSPQVPPAPAAGMYWSRAITYGKSPSRPLRAHSANLIGEFLYVFGGCDMRTCFNTLYVLDMDTLTWSKPRTSGQIPPPCRAHSCTTVERDTGSGRKAYSLYVFGGGDGPNYFNDLYVLNTDTLVWSKPKTSGEPPSPRRAHTTCIWNQKIIIVGGGDGARALADVHTLDLTDPQVPKWSKLQTEGMPPIARGYHTSNLVKDKLIVYGGSDGHECFSDVYILDLVNNRWSQIDLDRPIPRLAHSATQVGSYVFVIGGHDGSRYSNDVLLLNLVTMSWETRKIYGGAPSPRGYHTAVLHDSRLYVFGGYDGRHVFEDVYMLELSACAYLPQITNFEIDVY